MILYIKKRDGQKALFNPEKIGNALKKAFVAVSQPITDSQVGEMTEYVVGMAEDEGLQYDFDKAVSANSFNAHRLLQYAKTQGKGDELKEKLLAAYFTEGKNTYQNPQASV